MLKKHLGVEQIDCLSDKGYFDFMQIKQCVDNGVTPYVAVKRSGSGGSIVSPEFTADKFLYDKSADVYVCPAGQRLFFHLLYCSVKGWIGEFTSVQRVFALHASFL